jgi:tRNA-splicing ligase RtcB
MGKQQPLEALVERLDPNTLSIDNAAGVPIRLFANEEVAIERNAVAQIRSFAGLATHIAELVAEADFFGGGDAALERIVLTPDFHAGSGIPVGTVAATRGFVLPKAVGNDVCCGMRLLLTDLRPAEIEGREEELERALRGIFFEGRRDIPMSPRQREAMLREGLCGLYETRGDNAARGLWRRYDPRRQLDEIERVHHLGSLTAREVFSFGDFIEASGEVDSRDAQIGSVGGGNHFVELQALDDLLDAPSAHAWGLERDRVAIMAHSGSVGLGHMVGGYFGRLARELYPDGLEDPPDGFYPLPTIGPHAAEARRYLDAMRNAANFAFANRLFLGLMTLEALERAVGRPVDARLIYDVPHNLIWGADDGPAAPDSAGFVHRKGACPAFGPEPERDGPWRYTGHPVVVPGSMGTASFVLAGRGARRALSSACHGAGRVLSRGAARNVDEATYAEAMRPIRVVTPIDPDAPMTRRRSDILERYHRRVREEAPFAYKPVRPVIDSIEGAGIAKPVARLRPLLTVKG